MGPQSGFDCIQVLFRCKVRPPLSVKERKSNVGYVPVLKMNCDGYYFKDDVHHDTVNTQGGNLIYFSIIFFPPERYLDATERAVTADDVVLVENLEEWLDSVC